MINTIEYADQIAAIMHEGQFDKGGEIYINHPREVAKILQKTYPLLITDNDIMAALLHDIVEDTDMTAVRLGQLGFNRKVVDAVVALTKIKSPIYEDYNVYMDRVMLNPIAMRVKICDMTHNMDLRRMKRIENADLTRQAKYEFWIEVLKEELSSIDPE